MKKIFEGDFSYKKQTALDRRKSRVLELNQKHQEMARKRVSMHATIM